MDDALFGTEIEYGCVGSVQPVRAALLVKDAIFRGCRHGLIDPPPREWGEVPGNGGFLFNGGRMYLDLGHLEHATAECRTLTDIVAHERAGESIVNQAVQAAELKSQAFFVKNNTDYFGHTFGYHENYCIRQSPYDSAVVDGMLPFLVTRQIYAGAGCLLPRGDDTPAAFALSQRAQFVTIDVSHRVRFGGRPIINLRDEPLAERKYRRLHVIVGDVNRSEFTTALKIGTTALVAQLLEQGWSPQLVLADPVRDLRRIAATTGGNWTVGTETDEYIPAIEVQRGYLREAERRFAGRDADTVWTLENWAWVLDELEQDPARLDGYLDWVTKHEQIKRFAGADKAWTDPDLIKLDLSYHQIDPTVSLFDVLTKRHRNLHWVESDAVYTAESNAPPDTRAHGRSLALRALAAAGADTAIPWQDLRSNLENLMWDRRFFFLAYDYVDDWQDVAANNSWDVIPYVLDWKAIAACGKVLEMPNPFATYDDEARDFGESIQHVFEEESDEA